MLLCRGAQELRQTSIWSDETTQFCLRPSSLFTMGEQLIICELKSQTTLDTGFTVKELMKSQAAAAAAK